MIRRRDQEIIIQDGRLLNRELLSSGTAEGIDLAVFLASMMFGGNCFYYCDEHFSYIQSDLEKRIFGLMVERLGQGGQLIFSDILTECERIRPSPGRQKYALPLFAGGSGDCRLIRKQTGMESSASNRWKRLRGMKRTLPALFAACKRSRRYDIIYFGAPGASEGFARKTQEGLKSHELYL